MQLRYDEDFIESGVSLCVSGRRQGVPAMQIARFHRERERLYHILDADERNTAFFKLHLDWFREWGMERLLSAMLRDFPLIKEELKFFAVRKATGKKDEGAELYVNAAGQRTGLLALRMERFTHETSLEPYLRHEFMHLNDMLDPAFGYSPVLHLPDMNAAQRRLAAERYRLLWDITIDGRLTATGRTPMATREQHAAGFTTGYCFWSEQRQVEVFETLWRDPAPNHSHLLALVGDPRGLRDAPRPAPGASCPLCDFPTFAWTKLSELTPELEHQIVTEFPQWVPEQGLCRRCLETFEAVARARIHQ